jgi:UDP-N-acetylmuramyl pentapeptide phosphotransferase/UDP-N-acetylglucosamine-1-phosphate transferase
MKCFLSGYSLFFLQMGLLIIPVLRALYVPCSLVSYTHTQSIVNENNPKHEAHKHKRGLTAPQATTFGPLEGVLLSLSI